MSRPVKPDPVKLMAAFLYRETTDMSKALGEMEARFDGADAVSDEMVFDFTEYYCREMGKPLYRRFVCFRELLDPGNLAEIKLWTNDLEHAMESDSLRRVNVDPGVLCAGSLVLATCKPAPHRPYLGSGVFADLTLMYSEGEYRPLEWTYPDYRDERVRAFMGQARELLLFELRSIKRGEWRGPC